MKSMLSAVLVSGAAFSFAAGANLAVAATGVVPPVLDCAAMKGDAKANCEKTEAMSKSDAPKSAPSSKAATNGAMPPVPASGKGASMPTEGTAKDATGGVDPKYPKKAN